MRDRRLAKTANRSVIGIMNEFTFLAESHRGDTPAPDLLALAMHLAGHALRPSLPQTRKSRPRTGRAVARRRTASELTPPTPATQIAA
jgi:hypothetical protein